MQTGSRMTEATEATAPARHPWTVRLAGWSAKHRWPVVGLWLVFTIGLFVGSLAAGGTNSAEAVSDDDTPKFESGEAYDLFGRSGPQGPPSQQLMVIVAVDGSTVDDPSFSTVIGDAVARLSSARASVGGADQPALDQVIDPLTAPPDQGLVAPDRTAARIVARVPGDGQEVDDRLVPIRPLVDSLRADHPDYEIHALNSTLANDDIQELVNGGLDASLRLTIPLTFIILVVAFGAVVAAFVPLVLAVTALLAAFGMLGLYSQIVGPVSPYAGQLVVLIGLAVAVDYSLFMVSRFRTERRHGRDKLASIGVASSTAGRAVFFSGLAVMISVAGLFMLDDPLFRSMAIGTIAVVLVSVIGSLTFLPATLAILGDGVNRLRVPVVGRDRTEGSGLWATLVRSVMRRPLVFLLVVGAAMIALASPVIRLHMGNADFTAFPDSIDGVQAVNLLNERWPQGSTLQLAVVVTKANEEPTKAAIDRLKERLPQVEGLSGPVETRQSADGTVAMVTCVMSGGANDIHNRDLVHDLRGELVPSVLGGLTGVRALVTGDAAYTADVAGYYANGMPLVMAFVLGLSFILLLVAFRSIVIPIKAILLNLLSTGAAYGLLVLVFQDGRLADVFGFKPGPIEAFVPVFIFTILFGLSMDYHVFILTRIKEARDRGLSSNEAVARGISITSGTVTSAAAIMVVVFAVFVTLELTIIKQLGFGLAVAVFLDATVVRSILLPASMRLLGDWNWWLPGFLSWLPRVTIEDVAGDAPETPGLYGSVASSAQD
jgi:uncharacterized membrane protein YdfJ with MMPL/SSD domain